VILETEAQARHWFADKLGCDPATLEKLNCLVDLLTAENARQNLVSAASLAQVWVRHLADSAQLLDVSRGTPKGPWLDLGSGAGFPGLVVALCRPDIAVTLVESRARRIAWLKEAAAALGLANVTVEGKRLEALPTLGAGTISARAFAPFPQLIALSARFSTPETLWLLPKGRTGRQELLQMTKPIQSMFHVKQSMTDAESVILVGHGTPRQGERP
jgi:16S rRNA (guanine527-N7)-methyltransferase